MMLPYIQLKEKQLPQRVAVFGVEPRGIDLHLCFAQIEDALRQAVARNSPLGYCIWSVRFPIITPLTIKDHRIGGLLLLKTNPNFDTNAPPFEVRGCKVILGGAFFSQGGANRV